MQMFYHKGPENASLHILETLVYLVVILNEVGISRNYDSSYLIHFSVQWQTIINEKMNF